MLILAVLAGTLEEIAFRKTLMDWIEQSGGGAAIQIVLSGASFGLMHIVWGGLRGSWVTALGSVAATTILGLGLAMVIFSATAILRRALSAISLSQR